ncbi:MAG: sodium:proton antiporter [Rhodocyclaceae bacterium]|nr:sodium:proton antiporter [Rhodocyclaceae bacterium]
MHADLPLIVTLASAFGLALLLGVVATRLRLPALVGYLAAGVLIGPHTPGFVADTALAMQLAEVGVMLLMFGVGLHFSIDDLLSVRRVAIPGAVVQMAVATGLGAALALAWGWSITAALVFGLALSVASTVVLLRALEARGALETPNGRIAVGWLVVEDLAMVLVLVLLPVLAGGQAPLEPGDMGLGEATQGDMALGATLLVTLLEVAAFVAVMLLAGRRVLPWILWQVSGTGSRELFTLCVVALAVSIAFGAAALFGVSVALGAFFAGLVLRESEFSQRAAEESLPFRDAFAVLFFVSVGMLFDPAVLVSHPLQVLATTLVIVVGKSIAAGALVLALRYPLGTALTVSASLAQIGEFSFILATLGNSLGVLPDQAASLIVAGAIVSIAINPLLFGTIEPLRRWALARSELARELDARSDPLAELPQSTEASYLSGQVVLVGHGRAGQRVAAALEAAGTPFVVVEEDREIVESLRGRGYKAVLGDAREPLTLVQAHVATARLLVLAVADPTLGATALRHAKRLRADLPVLARAETADEAARLREAGAERAIAPPQAMGDALAGAALEALGRTA